MFFSVVSNDALHTGIGVSDFLFLLLWVSSDYLLTRITELYVYSTYIFKEKTNCFPQHCKINIFFGGIRI
jgi:hypothetical protein